MTLSASVIAACVPAGTAKRPLLLGKGSMEVLSVPKVSQPPLLVESAMYVATIELWIVECVFPALLAQSRGPPPPGATSCSHSSMSPRCVACSLYARCYTVSSMAASTPPLQRVWPPLAFIIAGKVGDGCKKEGTIASGPAMLPAVAMEPLARCTR